MTQASNTQLAPPADLARRLDVLARLDQAGALPTEVLDRLTRLATELTGAPVGLAVLVDDHRQVFVSQVGLDEPWASLGETPLSHSFCQHVVASGTPLIVTDARQDPVLHDNLAIRDLGVIAYAGVPLDVGGVCIGSFCVIDGEPREWSARDLRVLGDLAASAVSELRLHLAVSEQAATVDGLRASDARYRSVIAAMVDGVVLQDRAGVIHECNAAAERILGLTADQMMGRSSLDPRWRSIHEDGTDYPGSEHPSVQTLATGVPYRDAVMGVHKPTGELTWISICTEPLLDQTGVPTAVVVTFTDITARKEDDRRREAHLAEQQALRALATLVASDAAPRAVFAAAAQHAARVLRAAASDIVRLDASGEATVAGVWSIPPASGPLVDDTIDLQAATATGQVIETGLPATVLMTSGTPQDPGISSSFAVPITVDAHLWGVLTVSYDRVCHESWRADALDRLTRFADLVSLGISSAEAREQLAKLASTDHLTGLCNQRVFFERLDDEVRRARRHGGPLSLVVFDIDHFKHINDTHGHAAGNGALTEFARRLAEASRGGEIMARVGGEEFAWILPGTDSAGAYAAAERLRSAIATTPFGEIGTMTTSAGVSELAHADDARELFRNADIALYQAKSEGRNATLRYEPAVS